MPAQFTTCAHCGTPFPTDTRQALDKRTKFCSRQCRVAPLLDRDIAEVFWSRVDCSGDGCWEYRNTKPGAYGSFRLGSVSYANAAHRLAYTLTYGPIPEGLWVLHVCDNKRCCRPDHLFLGTPADNTRDMVNKGRHAHGDRAGCRVHPERVPRGERHHNARLTEDVVREMRALRSQGWIYQAIGDHFGVNIATAYYVVNGKGWKHVA